MNSVKSHINKKIDKLQLVDFGGEGEDRTRAPETRPNSLANCPLNPLGTSPLSVAQTV